MKQQICGLARWLLVGISASSMLGCLSADEVNGVGEDVETDSAALIVPNINPAIVGDHLGVFQKIIEEQKKAPYTLTVKTCDVTNAQSGDAVYVGVVTDFYSPEIAVGKLGAQRNASVTVDLTGYVPIDPNSLKGITLRKRGHDGWCISRVELRRQGVLIWRFDESDSRERDTPAPDTNYAGLHTATGALWIDDDRADAPASSAVFSDRRLPMPPSQQIPVPGRPLLLPGLFGTRPVELEITTCKAGTHPQTDDPVHAVLSRDGIRETINLDNLGNDREAGSVDRYTLNEHGLNALGSLEIRKEGSDGWCVDSIAIYAGGREVFKQSQRLILDVDPNNASVKPATILKLDMSAADPKTANSWYYPGLPLSESPFWFYEHGAQGEECRSCEPGTITTLGTCRPCDAGLMCDSGTCVATGGADERCKPASFNIITGTRTEESCDGPLECVTTGDGRRCVSDAGTLWAACRDEDDPRGQCNPSERGAPLFCDPVGNICSLEQDLHFVDSVGDTSCAYGATDCNRCVHHVRSAWEQFRGSGGKRVSYIIPSGMDDFLKWTGRGGRHFQSFVRVPYGSPDTPMFLASHGGKEGASGHFLSVNGRSGDAIGHFKTGLSNHPGGMQAIGGYVLVAHDKDDGDGPAYIEVLSAHNPRQVYRTISKNIGTKIPTTEKYRAASIGGAKLADGKYLLVTNQSSTRPYYDFFRANDLKTLSGLQVVNTRHDAGVGSENISLVTDCETGGVYAISVSGEGKLRQYRGENYWRLFKVGTRGAMFALDLLDEVEKARDTECDGRSAASAGAGPNGELALYCHQRSDVDTWGDERIYYRRYWVEGKGPMPDKPEPPPTNPTTPVKPNPDRPIPGDCVGAPICK